MVELDAKRVGSFLEESRKVGTVVQMCSLDAVLLLVRWTLMEPKRSRFHQPVGAPDTPLNATAAVVLEREQLRYWDHPSCICGCIGNVFLECWDVPLLEFCLSSLSNVTNRPPAATKNVV